MNWICKKTRLLNRCLSISDGPRTKIRLIIDQFKGANSHTPWGTVPGFVYYRLKNPKTGASAECISRKLKSDWIIFREIFCYDDYATVALFSFTPSVIYDIGSNAGLAAVYLHLLYPSAKIYGFEPGTPEHVCAVKNYTSNSFGTVFQVAAGDFNGELPFFADEKNSGGQRLESTPTPTTGDLLTHTELRRVVRLEDYAVEMSIPQPDLIKMDIEGFEVMALNGMGSLLKKARGIIMETHGAELHSAVIQIITDAGFKILADEHRFGPYRILVAERSTDLQM